MQVMAVQGRKKIGKKRKVRSRAETSSYVSEICDAIEACESLVIGAMLRMRFRIGLAMKKAIDSGECKSIDIAMGKAADEVEKRLGRQYGYGWWKANYYMAERLSQRDRKLILQQYVSVGNVVKLVNLNDKCRQAQLERLHEGKMLQISSGSKSTNKKNVENRDVEDSIIFPRQFDKTVYEDRLAALIAYIRKVEDGPDMIINASRRAGLPLNLA